jgi:hypothetical protein
MATRNRAEVVLKLTASRALLELIEPAQAEEDVADDH